MLTPLQVVPILYCNFSFFATDTLERPCANIECGRSGSVQCNKTVEI